MGVKVQRIRNGKEVCVSNPTLISWIAGSSANDCYFSDRYEVSWCIFKHVISNFNDYWKVNGTYLKTYLANQQFRVSCQVRFYCLYNLYTLEQNVVSPGP